VWQGGVLGSSLAAWWEATELDVFDHREEGWGRKKKSMWVVCFLSVAIPPPPLLLPMRSGLVDGTIAPTLLSPAQQAAAPSITQANSICTHTFFPSAA